MDLAIGWKSENSLHQTWLGKILEDLNNADLHICVSVKCGGVRSRVFGSKYLSDTLDAAMYRSVVSLLLAGAAVAQTSKVPYDPGIGPTFRVAKLAYSCGGTYASIRAIDFRNFSYAGTPVGAFKLRKGTYKHDALYDHQSAQYESVDYLPERAAGEQTALVLLSWFAAGGSSSQGGIAQVFTHANRRLTVVQQIDWDAHFAEGKRTVSFNPATSTLIVRSAHYLPGDAHCCISAVDVVSFKWNGEQFAQIGLQTELSEYGKREHKSLPH